MREHPFSFENEFSARYRSPNLYKAIDEIGGAELISLEHDPFTLIDKSKAVATLTGTVGVQAVCRNRPVIAFGHPAYKGLHGVAIPDQDFDLKEYLSLIERGSVAIESSKVRESLLQLEREGFGYYVGNENPYGVECRDRALSLASDFWIREVVHRDDLKI